MPNDNWQIYNAIDAAVDFHIWEEIEADVTSGDYADIYRQTMDLYEPVIFMMTTGLLVDRGRLEIERQRTIALQTAAEAELNELSGGLNALSPKQCITYFYVTLGHTPYTGGSGKPTSDDKAMARLARKGVREAKLVQEIRGLNKLRGTYLDVETDSDGRVRTSYNLRGTREGRISSSQNIFGTGMNLQNLHPAFKSFIVPDPGKIFVELDKRQSEWVITAYASGDPTMIGTVERGEDVHVTTGCLISGLDRAMVEMDAAFVGHETDQDKIFEIRQSTYPEIYDLANFLPRSMSVRQAGKKSDHGLNYIMGYWRFALENEIPEKEAKIMVNAYREGYSGLPAYWERVNGRLSRNRTLVNCFGRPRRFLGQMNDDLLKAGVAYMSQSTNADLVNQAIIKTYNDPAPYIEPLTMSAQVHDSILNQFPIGDWKTCAQAMLREKEHLNPTMCYEGREFQIETDMEIGLNWGKYDGKHNLGGMSSVKFVNNPTELADRMEEQFNNLVA